MWATVLVLSALAAATTAQDASQLDLEVTLCDGHRAGDYFRLSATTCRDVYACTSERRLHALRCPTGLAFDIERQTCDWSHTVPNCHVLRLNKTDHAVLNALEPICQDDATKGKRLACADGICISKAAFCNGTAECADGSDEAEAICSSAKTDPNGAPTCDRMPDGQCQLPECFCSKTGTKPPGDMLVEDIPMMIAITFEDAINEGEMEVFQRIFDSRKNRDGCNVKGTFFVSHEYTNYSTVQVLHSRGHEIAGHSVSHLNDPDYWRDGNATQWTREVGGIRTMLSAFAGIPVRDVRGFRSPMMRLGGNAQFAALSQSGYKYDASVVAGMQDPPLWPYTLHASLPHPCHGYRQRCPTKPFGVWEMVINELDASGSGGRSCVTPDTCNIDSPEDLYDILSRNFVRSQATNKAPLGLHFQAAWFAARPDMLDALLYWMDEVLRLYPNETYFVTLSDIVAWMEHPTPLSQLDKFAAWQRGVCGSEVGPAAIGCEAGQSRTCVLTSSEHRPGAHHRLDTCNKECPASYPWLLDPLGEKAPAFK